MNEKTELNNIAPFSAINAALEELKRKHTGVVHDVKTTAGMKAAKADRAEVKEYRVSVETKRVELKAPHLAAGREIDAEAARITGELSTLEKSYDEQIKAEEKRKAAEAAKKAAEEQAARDEALRKEREQAAAALAEAAEREKALKAQIAALEAAKPAPTVAPNAIAALEAMDSGNVPAGWERIEGGDELPYALDAERANNQRISAANVPAAHDAALLDLLDSEPARNVTGEEFIAAPAQRFNPTPARGPRELPTAQQVEDALSAHAQKRTSIRNVCDVLDAIRAVWAQ